MKLDSTKRLTLQPGGVQTRPQRSGALRRARPGGIFPSPRVMEPVVETSSSHREPRAARNPWQKYRLFASSTWARKAGGYRHCPTPKIRVCVVWERCRARGQGVSVWALPAQLMGGRGRVCPVTGGGAPISCRTHPNLQITGRGARGTSGET